LKKTWFLEYFWIVLGCFFLAVGMNSFLVPARLSSGGVGGIATVLLHTLQIPLWATNLLLNGVLFVVGYRLLGKGAVLKTVAGIAVLSLFLELTAPFPAFASDLLLATACGGVLVGVGVGLVVRVGGSTGGSDFAALMLKKYAPHLSVATVILLIDCGVIALSALVFRSVSVAFYSALSMVLSSKVTDAILVWGNAAKALLILSEEREKIRSLILEKYGRGLTELDGRGSFSGEKKKVLLSVMSPKEASKLLREIRQLDPSAFVIVNDAREVLGEGFQSDPG